MKGISTPIFYIIFRTWQMKNVVEVNDIELLLHVVYACKY